MEFLGQSYELNQMETLPQFIGESKPGEYMRYYDMLVFHTEDNTFMAANNDDLSYGWEI